jgi:hypothetical protein
VVASVRKEAADRQLQAAVIAAEAIEKARVARREPHVPDDAMLAVPEASAAPSGTIRFTPVAPIKCGLLPPVIPHMPTPADLAMARIPHDARVRLITALMDANNWRLSPNGKERSCKLNLGSIFRTAAQARLVTAILPREYTSHIDAECNLHLSYAVEERTIM